MKPHPEPSNPEYLRCAITELRRRRAKLEAKSSAMRTAEHVLMRRAWDLEQRAAPAGGPS